MRGMKRVTTTATILGGLLIVTGITGCSAPRIHQQRRVSQPDMTFSSSSVWNFDQPLSLQTESGRAFAGGGSAAGCTSCR